jgi:hypothetical protein
MMGNTEQNERGRRYLGDVETLEHHGQRAQGDVDVFLNLARGENGGE